MPKLEYIPPEKRIKKYQAEIKYHEGKSGYASQFMQNLYEGMLAAAQDEIKEQRRHSS